MGLRCQLVSGCLRTTHLCCSLAIALWVDYSSLNFFISPLGPEGPLPVSSPSIQAPAPSSLLPQQFSINLTLPTGTRQTLPSIGPPVTTGHVLRHVHHSSVDRGLCPALYCWPCCGSQSYFHDTLWPFFSSWFPAFWVLDAGRFPSRHERVKGELLFVSIAGS